MIGAEVIHALKSVILDINKGEFVALMGPSGSGKSTLMNILGCLDTPSKGDYILNGINVSQMRKMNWLKFAIKKLDLFFRLLIYYHVQPPWIM